VEARPLFAILPGASALLLARSMQLSAWARGGERTACRPLADDLATVGLDTQMAQARCRRGGRNRLLGD
jgi:hypothetical protein